MIFCAIYGHGCWFLTFGRVGKGGGNKLPTATGCCRRGITYAMLHSPQGNHLPHSISNCPKAVWEQNLSSVDTFQAKRSLQFSYL